MQGRAAAAPAARSTATCRRRWASGPGSRALHPIGLACTLAVALERRYVLQTCNPACSCIEMQAHMTAVSTFQRGEYCLFLLPFEAIESCMPSDAMVCDHSRKLRCIACAHDRSIAQHGLAVGVSFVPKVERSTSCMRAMRSSRCCAGVGMAQCQCTQALVCTSSTGLALSEH